MVGTIWKVMVQNSKSPQTLTPNLSSEKCILYLYFCAPVWAPEGSCVLSEDLAPAVCQFGWPLHSSGMLAPTHGYEPSIFQSLHYALPHHADTVLLLTTVHYSLPSYLWSEPEDFPPVNNYTKKVRCIHNRGQENVLVLKKAVQNPCGKPYQTAEQNSHKLLKQQFCNGWRL